MSGLTQVQLRTIDSRIRALTPAERCQRRADIRARGDTIEDCFRRADHPQTGGLFAAVELLALVEQAALNEITAVASERQAALLARLREPETLEAVQLAIHKGLMRTQPQSYLRIAIDEARDAALAVITEMLT